MDLTFFAENQTILLNYFSLPYYALLPFQTAAYGTALLILRLHLFQVGLQSFVLQMIPSCGSMHHTHLSLQPAQAHGSHCSWYIVIRWPALPFRGMFLMPTVWCINIYVYMYKYTTHVNNSSTPVPPLGMAFHSPPLGILHLLCVFVCLFSLKANITAHINDPKQNIFLPFYHSLSCPLGTREEAL